MKKIMRKRKLIKNILSVALAGVLVLGITACGSNGKSSSADSKSNGKETSSTDKNAKSNLKPLRIGVGGADGSGILEGAALAVKNKYFEKELAKVGYYPKYVYFTGAGPEINEAFAGGTIDAAIVGDFPAFASKSNGIDNTIIALTNQKVNYGILTTVKDAKSIEDLKGKTAAVYNGSITQFFWQKYLEAKKIKEDEIPYVNTTDATTLLTSGDVQVYPVTAYMAYYLELKGLGHVIDTTDVDIWTTFVFEINSKILKSNTKLGVAVNKALIRAAKAAQKNPQSQYNALASKSISAKAWQKYYSKDPTLSNLSPEITDKVLDYYESENKWMLDNGVIKNSVDVKSFVDTSYYKKALKELEK